MASEPDVREIAATLFDVASSMAKSIGSTLSGEAAAALVIASGLAAAVGSLVRSVGLSDASELIAELQARKSEGTISPEQIARDDGTIADAVSDLYRD